MKSASDQTLSNISDNILNGGVQVKLLGRPFPQRFYNILPICEPNMTLVQSLQKVEIVLFEDPLPPIPEDCRVTKGYDVIIQEDTSVNIR